MYEYVDDLIHDIYLDLSFDVADEHLLGCFQM